MHRATPVSRTRNAATLVLFLTVTLSSCSSNGDAMLHSFEAEWVDDVPGILGEFVVDPTGDFTAAGPPYSEPVAYAPVDMTQVAFGVAAGYLYVRVDYDRAMPTRTVRIHRRGEVEAQRVTGQSFSLVFDTDGDDHTGAGATGPGNTGLAGVDIFFGISVDYGLPPEVYANYDFSGDDIHLSGGQISGELGAGGPGYPFMIVRYDVSQLDPAFWPPGTTVEFSAWSEAESDLYHEFANDWMFAGAFDIPG